MTARTDDLQPQSSDNSSELAERCEAATGPDRGLDALIARSLGIGPVGLTTITFPRDPATERYERYTASLDAAMALRPDGHTLANMSEEDTHDPLRKCAAEYRRCFKTSYDKAFPVRAATLPLALCAAALKARAAQ